MTTANTNAFFPGNANFAATDMIVTMPMGKSGTLQACRAYVPAADILSWDVPETTTTHSLYLDTRGHLYVEIKITGRGDRRHANGCWGTKALVRFTGPDSTGEWRDAVVLRREGLAFAA